jgi:hypothetical protein
MQYLLIGSRLLSKYQVLTKRHRNACMVKNFRMAGHRKLIFGGRVGLDEGFWVNNRWDRKVLKCIRG